ncbi:MAG: RDD family protein [Candidatus Dormibacteria bacterium]
MSTPPPPDTLRVQTADNVALGYATAGVGSRMIAQLVDSAVALVLVFAVVLAVVAAGSFASSGQAAQWTAGAAAGAAFLVYFGYFLLAEAVMGGRTPGKAAMGVRVVMLDGSAPDFSALVVRNLVRIVDVGVVYVGVVVMFFHPLSRRLGDLAAGTVVVRERQNVSLAAVTAPMPLILRTPDAGPAIDGVERLGTPEENALRVFLSRQGLTPPLRARLASQLAVKLYDRLELPWGAPERMWPAELFLERLYLQLIARST